MRSRLADNPVLRKRLFYAMSACMVAFCALLAGLFRLSLSDVNAHPGTLDQLPYAVKGVARTEFLAASQDSDEVLGAIVAPEALFETSPLVVTARFTGSRHYVYRAFRSDIEVTSVIKGRGVNAGQTLQLLESYEITTRNGYDGGHFTADRIIAPVGNGPESLGLSPMRTDQEYLLFLVPKEYPDSGGAVRYAPTYCLANSPYARISTNLASDSELAEVRTRDDTASTMQAYEEMSLAEASSRDIRVFDEDAKATYLDTALEILDRTTHETPEQAS